AYITEKKIKEKLKKKRLEVVPIVQNFSRTPSPYRLAHSEMHEPTGKWQVFPDKGLIRPSSSSWGDLGLFVKKKDGSFSQRQSYAEAFTLEGGDTFWKTGKVKPEVHSTFHVSNLKKCLFDESLVIPLDEIQVDDKLHFMEEPIEIIDQEIKQLKQRRIPIIKV
nr:reverse transcriptase domain-containing protein [Tanacetum cinerariifolium]